MRIPNYTGLGAAMIALAAGMAVTALPRASATTLTCTQVKTVYVTPYGCGGLELGYQARGVLDMAAAGNYWNAAVRAEPESVTDTAEDWTVFALNGSTTGGQDDLGQYTAMLTPDGVIPGGCAGGLPCSASNPDVAVSPADFCLSVENITRTVRGHPAQRWVAVLRSCFAAGGGDPATPGFVLGAAPTGINTVDDPNLYQLWSPVLATTAVPSPIALVNVALLSPGLRHGIGGNDDYVLDDSGSGGAGTQLLAYPADAGLNQEWSVIGCTPPVTQISGLNQLCP
jgi:hypothetical protein